jgi:Bacterial Immunoglobulin-like 21
MKTIIKMKSLRLNNSASGCMDMFYSYSIPSFSLLLLVSFLSLSLVSTQSAAIAAVDIDTSGDGRAAAYDGEEGIATNGDSFCSITNDIAGGKFSSLFEGIVGKDCDNNSQLSNQFLVEYSYTKNPVKIGEKTYLTITVKDKETGNPISNAFVTLAIEHAPSSLRDNVVSTALAVATTIPAQEDVQDKTTQTMYTDNKGHATFTVQLGPNSDMGVYNTEIEITKDSYQSNFQQTNLHVI